MEIPFSALILSTQRLLSLIRAALGMVFFMAGAEKLILGIDKWNALGEQLDLDLVMSGQLHVLLGAYISFAEFFGGIFLILGLFTRTACSFLMITLVVASIGLVNENQSLIYNFFFMILLILFSLPSKSANRP